MEKLGAQTIVQYLFAIRDSQLLISRSKNPELKTKQELQVLQAKLKAQILSWGGIDAIEQYLKEHDPGHSLPSGISGIDLSWLEE